MGTKRRRPSLRAPEAGACCPYAITTITARTAAITIAALPLTTGTIAVGAVCLLPIAVVTGLVVTTDLSSLAAIGYLGIITMAAASLLLFTRLRSAPAKTAAVATLLEPATATGLAALLLGEALVPSAAAGIVLSPSPSLRSAAGPAALGALRLESRTGSADDHET
ncbi:EamA family transporter [Rathayibacter caricis]|uniref:EamA family transporter n=1 Tax=Rathayibacter caricis TaxID=110936 RepID=UPI001FD1266C|nr:EamA family transporter [Rathayibacter caricis]